ncbi:hypothetical protein ABEX84_21420 [Bacillus subtilis]|uniref:hypothetical protein n=1 Tax=Bacillus subtilis TaxID=1423 RepID=UPI002DBC5573|nr:hypothetical protein [Bacillus subtilis]MEC3696418.1 hypothetical protein [Bacillus subtilis]
MKDWLYEELISDIAQLNNENDLYILLGHLKQLIRENELIETRLPVGDATITKNLNDIAGVTDKLYYHYYNKLP